eukprot:TRINITY_DN935_c0_g3_i1.p1 TRINITY_DN935_c0_g3~~TRINITY_DN935_c0_g3_i1.p1  ORF type:complete len:229 (-),score=78.84 TRINITY_DN935_c0_g3_i1:106-792(-)
MKNTVYALANENPVDPIENFAEVLADHFLSTQSQIHSVEIFIEQVTWERLVDDKGVPLPAAWKRGSNELRLTHLSKDRKGHFSVESGISDLIVLRSHGSAFVGYVKDKFTTLKETTDRIFCTSVKAQWKYLPGVKDYNKTFCQVRRTLLELFDKYPSPSVQLTLHQMGTEILKRVACVAEISLTLPNIHYLPVNVSVFGMKDTNSVFLPTDEPSGYIEGTISRVGAKL